VAWYTESRKKVEGAVLKAQWDGNSVVLFPGKTDQRIISLLNNWWDDALVTH
jgi:hypothetical protein